MVTAGSCFFSSDSDGEDILDPASVKLIKSPVK